MSVSVCFRHIQVQSEGSPGIIENLVLSLFHSHALGITSTNTHTAYKAGLVSPPASMLYRYTLCSKMYLYYITH